MNRISITLVILFLGPMLLFSSCSKPAPRMDPTGLAAGMTDADTIRILGKPHAIKSAGENKELYIYRMPAETIAVFLINGRIKNISHTSAIPY